MGLHASLFRFRIEELKQLHEFVEDQIKNQEIKLRDTIEEHQEEANTEEEKDIIFQMYEDEYNNYRDVFPSTFRYALVILLYSLLENRLRTLCKVIEAKTNPPILIEEFNRGKKKKSDILKSWLYIKEIGNIKLREKSRRWVKLQNKYRIIRNTIVHENGVIGKSKVPEMRSLLKKLKNAKNDTHRTIIIEKDFILEFVKTIQKFIILEVLDRKDIGYK